jgi:glyoxylase-like metal-dependent hydrolase (beta-lactamase superfamily II)
MILNALVTTAALALQGQAPEQTRQEVAPGLYVITGQGGNILFSTGEDGAFVVDDQFARVAEENLALIEEVSDGEIAFVLNTHYHGDHTGGNAAFEEVGATIVSTENVRRRLRTGNTDDRGAEEPSVEDALPQITFEDAASFYWNGDAVRAVALRDAHTDGDAMVHFEGADVLHTGDVFFSGRYPYIDVEGGGSARGMIAALERILEVAGPETTIVPGHGPVGGEAEVEEALAMLSAAYEEVARAVAMGASREEVVASDLLARFDEDWSWGFIGTDRMAGQLYDSITADMPDAEERAEMLRRIEEATLPARE